MTKTYKFSWITLSFVFVIAIVFLSEWIQKNGIIYFPSGFRHALILLLFVVNWIRFGKKVALSSKYRFAIIIMTLYLFFAYFSSNVFFLNYILGISFTFLFLTIFILGANTKSSQDIIIKIFNRLLVFIFLMSIFPIIQAAIDRSTLRYLPGFFREVGAFGTAMNIGTIIGLSLFIITSKNIYIYIAVFFSIGVLMTILKKTMISNIIVWLFFFYYHKSYLNRGKIIIYSSIFALIAFISFGREVTSNFQENQNYLNNVGAEGHVRLGMYIASFNIAKDYFPFGSGIGSFGSLASIVNGYSQIYYDYNVSDIGSNSANDVANGHHTLLDTYWPHILGELGFIGSIVFIYLWINPIRKAFKILNHSTTPFVKGICFYVILIGITIIWEGFSLYTPEVPAFIILNFGLGGLCFYHLQKKYKLI
jgi:hypothetical protein